MRANKNHWRVLLIESDTEIIKSISHLLPSYKYTIFEYCYGKQGIESLSEYSPDIVVLDLNLPDINAMDIIKYINNNHTNTQILVVTESSELGQMLECFRLDVADFIVKPFDNEAFLKSIERAQKRYVSLHRLQEYTNLIEERWMDTSEALTKTFNFQEKLIESSIDGIIGCDYDRRIIVFNKSMEKMLGYSKDGAIGKMFLYQLFSSEGWEKFQDQLYSEDLGGEDKLYLSEFTLISRAGEKIPVRLSAQVLFQENEEIGIVAFLRDLRTVQRLKQQFLEQTKFLHQDKMVSLGKLAASVVHEINNPLTGILNYIRLMSKILARDSISAEAVQKFRKYLEIMGSEVKRSSEIVSKLLTFARVSKLEFNDVDMNDVLERSILLTRHKLTLQNIQVKTHLRPELPKVLGDLNQLQQCILNLIFNAADAMPDGGTLTVKSEFDIETGWVQIKVIDTGRGIAKDNLAKIFDPFFSTKQEGKGLGLGLSVVYGIIDRHKGSIGAESEPGSGTIFSIQLPAIVRNSNQT